MPANYSGTSNRTQDGTAFRHSTPGNRVLYKATARVDEWEKHSRQKRADGKEPDYMGENQEHLVLYTKEYLKSHPNISIDQKIDSRRQLQSVFGTAQVGYQDKVFLDLTARNDWKVLIFSSFVKHLEVLAEAFRERGWKYALLTGATNNQKLLL